MKKVCITEVRKLKMNLAPVWGANSVWEKGGIVIVDELGDEEKMNTLQDLKNWLNSF